MHDNFSPDSRGTQPHTSTYIYIHIYVFLFLYDEKNTEGRRRVKTEAEIGVTLPQAKECLSTKEAGRGKEGSSRRLQREHEPANMLILNL